MKSRIEQLHTTLEVLYERYNHRDLIAPDPLQFVYRFDDPRDMEIAAFLSSSLAYGRVRQIEKSLHALFQIIGDSPYLYILHFNSRTAKKLNSFRHRFTSGDDVVALFSGLRVLLRTHENLQQAFLNHFSGDDDNVLAALQEFRDELERACRKCFAGEVSTGFRHLLPDPRRGSASKRLHLFLCWMVRSDNVCTGLWDGVDTSKLIVPIDTHMLRICRLLGMHDCKQANLKAAMQITEAFKQICPADPAKYDFALSRVGIIEGCTGKKHKRCEKCDLAQICLEIR